MSATDLLALVCCDLGSIVRGRSLPASELAPYLDAGVGWVPANHALTPLGPLAEPNPFGSTGDLRLLPDIDTRVRVKDGSGASALELVLCDLVETDGTPWQAPSTAVSARRPDRASGRARCSPPGELRARASAAGGPSRSSPTAGRAAAGAVLAGGPAPGRTVRRRCHGRARRSRCAAGTILCGVCRAPVRDSRGGRRGGRGGGSQRRAQRGGARGRPPARAARELHAAAEPRGSGQRGAHPSQPARRLRRTRALRRGASRGPERARRALRGRNPAARRGVERPERAQSRLGHAAGAPPLGRRRRLPGAAQP